MTYGRDRTVVEATIAVGESLSGEVAVGAMTIVGFQVPAGTEGTTISLQAWNGDTWGEVEDASSTPIAVTVAAGSYTALPPASHLAGLGRIRVRTGTSAAPTNQAGADATIGVVCV